MLNAEQALHTAVVQALQFLRYEGLSTRGQEARRILQEALATYAQETAAERGSGGERGSGVGSDTDGCIHSDLSSGQLR